MYARFVSWVVLTLCLSLSVPVLAQPASTPQLEAWVLTFGPGEPVFLKFGHNAILVRGRDPGTGAIRFERVYDYGNFGGSPTLVLDFLQGRMRYWVAARTLPETLYHYRATNRDVIGQKLRLTQSQALELFNRLEENIKKENRYYRYDYYYDNCSTRVRDVLDDLMGGAIREGFSGPARMTLRQHTLRHTADDLMYYLGLDIGLANVDASIDGWVESFLPYKLRERLAQVQISVDGKAVPLVEKEKVWFDGTRPDVPEEPPERVAIITFVGVLIGLLLAALGRRGRRHFAWRWLFYAVAAVIGPGLGVFGVLLVYLWTSTDHSIAYANANIMNLAPWVVISPLTVLFARRPGARGLFWLFGSAAAFSGLGLAGWMFGVIVQDTSRITGLFLPIWIGLALAAWSVSRRPGAR